MVVPVHWAEIGLTTRKTVTVQEGVTAIQQGLGLGGVVGQFFAFLSAAGSTFVPATSAASKFVSSRSAPRRSAPRRHDRLRSAPPRSAPRRSALRRSASVRSAPPRSRPVLLGPSGPMRQREDGGECCGGNSEGPQEVDG